MTSTAIKEKIVFLEFEDEANAFLSYCVDNAISPQDFHIIAFQPQVQACLKRHNVRFENTLPYFSNDSHRQLLLKSEEWYSFLAQRANICDGSEIKETYNNTCLFFLRFYIHYFLFHCELIKAIIKKNNIESIFAFIYEDSAVVSAIITDDQRYMGRIAMAFAHSRGISFKPLYLRRHLSESSPAKFLYVNFLRSLSIFSKAYAHILLRSLKRNKKKCIVITTKSYNFQKIALQLKKEFPDSEILSISSAVNILFLRVSEILRRCEDRGILSLPIKLYSRAKSAAAGDLSLLDNSFDRFIDCFENEWLDYFKWHEVGFAEIFMPVIRKGIKAKLQELALAAEALRYIFTKIDIKLIISPFSRDLALLIAEIADRFGIPRLMISHGTLQPPKNDLEAIEGRHLGESLILSRYYDHIALQTPNEENVFHYYNPPQKKAFRTGPLVFSKVRVVKKADELRDIAGVSDCGTKILLYPENTRLRNCIRFHAFETFDEFLSSCADLVAAVEKIPAVHLVIRLHPGRKISTREFEMLLPSSQKLTVSPCDYPFGTILSLADLVINFSSTVIEDALQSRIPVLLYDKWNRYTHFESQSLCTDVLKRPSAVYHINNQSYLEDGIRWIVDNHLRGKVADDIFNQYIYSQDYGHGLAEFVGRRLYADA